ncbi:TetR/AcrR family transcriptional regulator [Aromatoleum evansii]|uniref:TetR/AcrR family transcriptional regulator n=1 Tax=Aromatoleum evansii TaxID=59406 RepID=A0ABZ1AEZ9_AROEV|nr:TetR/AcrR family transcriptional regulator [Aromatoleum evansii]NMG27670.1 TetR family transcriptional regulator [Aromatoleum evansii]WRL44433.1 TetR/AcrR family transcriptional regulator [Aromatoleum evansii]
MDSPRIRRSTELRRAEIVKAVLELAAESSPADVTTVRIAAAMQLTQGAVFRHFPTKEAIWLAVADWIEENLLGAVEEASLSSSEPIEQLRAMFRAHIGFAVAHPGAPRLIFHELQQPGDSAVKRRIRALLGSYRGTLLQVLKCAREGEVVGRELNVEHAATLFVGAIQGLVMQSMLAGGMRGVEESADGVFEVYLSGIAGRRA